MQFLMIFLYGKSKVFRICHSIKINYFKTLKLQYITDYIKFLKSIQKIKVPRKNYEKSKISLKNKLKCILQLIVLTKYMFKILIELSNIYINQLTLGSMKTVGMVF